MHTEDIAGWTHHHSFAAESATAERNTRRVVALTAAMMVVEIVTGLKFNSMALLADGWHMGTHVAAFLITALAYAVARRHAADARFSFGTGKVGVLGAFTSAIILGGIAVMVSAESVQRFFKPASIHYKEAIIVATIGLAVNVASAFLLKGGHGSDHHGHHHHHHHDVNLKAAYVHVIADALTSVLAIVALLGGAIWGWAWLDPVMGLVGGAVIAWWAVGLVRETYPILLDKEPEHCDLSVEIRKAVETDPDNRISDLHIWQIGVNKFAAIITVVTSTPQPPEFYKERLAEHEELVHVTVEVCRCASRHQPAPKR